MARARRATPRRQITFEAVDAAIRRGDWAAAEAELQGLLERTPTAPGVVERLALVLRQQERWDAVRELLLRVRNHYGLWPQGSDLLIGQALLELGDVSQAQRYLEQALDDADPGWGHHFLGKALRQQGDLEAALEQQRAASEALPDFVWAPFEAAQLLQELGRPLEAVVEAEEARRRSGGSDEALIAQLLEDLGPAQAVVEIDELLEAGEQEAAFVAMRQELIRHPANLMVRERARSLLAPQVQVVDAVPLSAFEQELQDFELLLDAFEADLNRLGA